MQLQSSKRIYIVFSVSIRHTVVLYSVTRVFTLYSVHKASRPGHSHDGATQVVYRGQGGVSCKAAQGSALQWGVGLAHMVHGSRIKGEMGLPSYFLYCIFLTWLPVKYDDKFTASFKGIEHYLICCLPKHSKTA